MPYSAEELQDLPFVISAPRFATYLRAQNNDREKALDLYEWNLRISAAFIVPLQVCEVAVRNGVVDAIEAVHGATWPWMNGFMRSLPQPKRTTDYNPAWDLARVAQSQPTTGKVVSELRFAFWEHLFTVGQDSRLWQPHMRRVFPGLPANLAIVDARKTAYDHLRAIRNLRNRVAHHEPIFNRNIHDEYQRLHELVSWRSPVAASWMNSRQEVMHLAARRP